MDSNLYHLSATERDERGIVALPGTLGEAVEELAEPELMKRALEEHILTLRRISARSGTSTGSSCAVGAGQVSGGPLDTARPAAEGAPNCGRHRV